MICDSDIAGHANAEYQMFLFSLSPRKIESENKRQIDNINVLSSQKAMSIRIRTNNNKINACFYVIIFFCTRINA